MREGVARAGRPLDLSLYLVVGPGDTAGRPVHDVVLEAVAGGVTAVQLRHKSGPARAFVEEARAVAEVIRPLRIPLLVNDRVDVALAAGADGVHVGQDDLAAADVRRLAGEGLIIGLSVTNAAEAGAVDPRVVDYAGVGPVFATATKPDAAPPLGVEGTRGVCAALAEAAPGLPAVAIGGVGPANAAAVLAAGVAGLAVVSAVCGAAEPRAAAAELAALVRAARGGRR